MHTTFHRLAGFRLLTAILLYLSLPDAAAHNGVGALLLVMMIWLLHRSTPGKA